MNTAAAMLSTSLSPRAGHRPLVLRGFGPTYRDHVSQSFVDTVSRQIIQATSFCGKEFGVELLAFLSPWDEEEDLPQGQLCLRVRDVDEKVIDITITFGLPGDADEPYRVELEPMLPDFNAEGLAFCEVIAGSFDECWLILCEVLDATQPTSVSFSFGL